MVNSLIKDASDEALHLRKLLKKYKVDFKQKNLSYEESLQHIENMVKVSSILYAQLEYARKL